jgi:hypothetical protein
MYNSSIRLGQVAGGRPGTASTTGQMRDTGLISARRTVL